MLPHFLLLLLLRTTKYGYAVDENSDSGGGQHGWIPGIVLFVGCKITPTMFMYREKV